MVDFEKEIIITMKRGTGSAVSDLDPHAKIVGLQQLPPRFFFVFLKFFTALCPVYKNIFVSKKKKTEINYLS